LLSGRIRFEQRVVDVWCNVRRASQSIGRDSRSSESNAQHRGAAVDRWTDVATWRADRLPRFDLNGATCDGSRGRCRCTGLFPADARCLQPTPDAVGDFLDDRIEIFRPGHARPLTQIETILKRREQGFTGPRFRVRVRELLPPTALAARWPR